MVRRLIKRFTIQSQKLPPAFLFIGGLGFFCISIAVFLWITPPSTPNPSMRAGVTFSVPYAKELNLNWREILAAALDDLHVRLFRIPVYWNIVEPEKNIFDWSSIDYQLDEIAKRNGHVILAIGAKLPRWPECWIPDWALQNGREGEERARMNYLRAVVERYKSHPAVIAWQVENEALFRFGVCPKPNASLLKKEIQLVRALDENHPIRTTDSGELSTWVRAGSLVDELGISTYRVVRTFWGALWEYTFLPPQWYAQRAKLLNAFIPSVYVSEFQMEPWVQTGITQTPVSEQVHFFSPERMQEHFDYSVRMGFNEVSFWGIEWWWWMNVTQGDSRYWKTAKEFFLDHEEQF